MTEHSTIYAALAAAQQSIQPITKDRRADVPTKAGGKYSYTYADLGTVLASVMPVLHENGIAVTQSTGITANGEFVLRTTLWHTAGDGYIEGDYLIKASNMTDPQAVGSAVTYARRYALIAMLCLATEDDDGQAARTPKAEPQPATPQQDQYAISATPPTLPMFTVNVANAMLIDHLASKKRRLKELADSCIAWQSPAHNKVMKDAVADDNDLAEFRKWFDSQLQAKLV